MSRQKFLKPALLAGAAVAAISTSAFSADFAKLGKGADISTICGEKPASVAMIDGYGGNTWRKIAFAEMKDEASKCPNIKRTVYSDAGGDAQKYNSDINSFVAQGYDIIMTFADFGDAALPAYRAAMQAGAVVVPYNAKLTGTPGVDYTANPHQEMTEVGKEMARWAGTNVKKGNVVFLGGFPGAATSQAIMEGIRDGIKDYPDLKLLDENYVVTNWNPADAQKVVAGLIAKYPQIDVVMSDYGVISLAGIKAFQQVGLPVPAQTVLASQNDINCKYLADKAAGKGWRYMSLDSTSTIVRFALRQGLAAFEGTKLDETTNLVPLTYVDSFKSQDPKCDENAPPDADFTSLLTQDELMKAIR
ncbi:substrate-binding domain-containing protein [Rhizobium multihospitium]|uniref:Ribose transport system substrate-binding protein n=1 Tax=Rhizobium multihospitium TaxID=410764 RepID=A0A1C3X5S2_9HYPH|nr:substrate-binding domain-containing protein [Rhizobium multihospitium]SCB47466.1 ribose transport system substrate-binding protein [Rhizobium multihospitium]